MIFFHRLQYAVDQYPVHFLDIYCPFLPYLFNTQVTNVCRCTCWLQFHSRPCQMASLLSANVNSRKHSKRGSATVSLRHTVSDNSNTWWVKRNLVTKCLHLLHPILLGDKDTNQWKACLITTEIVCV